MTILVTYATSYGSTGEVAEAVANTLREGGQQVDCQPVKQVGSLEGYSAVVLGAPIYIGKFHKDARRFLDSQQSALTQRPVAFFALGPVKGEAAEFEEIQGQLDAQLAEYPWLKPVALALFTGKFDPAKLRFPMSLLVKLPASPLKDMPASDNRDWDAIHAWAESLPETLAAAGQ